jgi:hypothetical protein
MCFSHANKTFINQGSVITRPSAASLPRTTSIQEVGQVLSLKVLYSPIIGPF